MTEGDEIAELLERVRGPVFALCSNMLGNRNDAEDALQETMCAVLEGLPGFRGEASFTTWVYRIALRTAVRLRARRRDDRRRSGPVAPCESGGPLEPGAPRRADPLLERELSGKLSEALQKLSAEHRSVISLFAVDGLAHAEIPTILGVSEGTVWSRLHRARKLLAGHLRGNLDADPDNRTPSKTGGHRA